MNKTNDYFTKIKTRDPGRLNYLKYAKTTVVILFKIIYNTESLIMLIIIKTSNFDRPRKVQPPPYLIEPHS